MQKQVRVVVDAMGGDNAPEEIVKGAVEAAASREDIQIIFTGREEVIKQELAKYEYPADRVSIVNATEVIETAEPPVNAIRKKKDSSIVVGMNLVKKKEADAFVSSGSTGAVLVGGQVIVGRIKGVERPPLGTPDSHRRQEWRFWWTAEPMWMPDPVIWCSLQRWVPFIWKMWLE